MKRKKKIFLDDKLTFPFGLKLVTKAKNGQKDCYYRGNLYVSGYQLTEAVRKINSNLTTLHEVLGIQDENENGDHIFIGVEDVEENIAILDEKLEDLMRFSGDIIPKYSKIEKEGKIIKINVNIDSQGVNEDGSSIHIDNIDSDRLEELIMQQIESPQTLNQMQSIKDIFWSMDTAISFYKNGLSKIRDCENILNGFLNGTDEEIVKVIRTLYDRFQKDHKNWIDCGISDEDKEPINPLEKDEKEVIKVFTEDKKKFLDNINFYIKPEFFELFRDILPPDFRDFSYDYVSWSHSDIGYGWYREDSGVNLEIYTTSLWFNLAYVSQETKGILTKKLSDLLGYLNKKYKEIEDKVNSLTEILAIKIPIMVYKIGIDDMIKLASIYCNIEFVNYDSIEVISEADLSKLDSFKYYIDSQCRIIIITPKGEFFKFIPKISIQEIKSPTFEDHIKISLEQKVNKEFKMLKDKTLEYFNKILSESIQLEEDNMQDQLKKNPDYMDLLERTIDAKLELKYVTEKIPDNMKELYVKTDWYMYQYLQGEATNGVLKQSL